MKKIYSLSDLAKILEKKRDSGNKIVMCHGVFDLIHLGHIEHFKKAKQYGDLLVVTTTSDEFINKGPGKPFFSAELRKRVLSNIECIDFVTEIDDTTAIKGIKKIKPNFYCKGKDYKKKSQDITGNIKKEIDTVKKLRGKIIFTDEISFSSSKLLNSNTDIFNKNQKKEINHIKKIYSLKKIQSIFKKIESLRVLVIGELILDEYVFVDPLGKSGKDPIMMFKQLKSQKYLGGSGYIANNISNFCKKVNLISTVGQNFEFKKFITSKLNKNVKLNIIRKKNSPTILKKKYIDNLSNNKLIGFYSFEDRRLDSNENVKLFKLISNLIKKSDLVLVSDYDHGMINQNIANLISKKSKFLVANTQYNAANITHHSINKYKKADYLVTNENELRNEMRDNHSDIKNIIKNFIRKSNIRNLIVTRGSEGAVLYLNKKNKFFNSEAYTSKVIDKIGAGDTLMSIFSIFLKVSKDPLLSLFLASLSAAQSVENLGNSKNIFARDLLKSLTHILK
tara:strand:+ start:9212 stop:10732 length:1521 start_codon:yes stop_codon:yes gene_type:complete